MRDLERPGRSPVYAPTGMAATSHPLSTQVAIQVLQDGGNALDAAVAACATQCVVEPQSTGIGGDCFCLYVPGGSSEVIAYNGSGRAPAAADVAWYQKQGITEIEQQSPHAVTIPGAVDAWFELINDHGTKSLGELLQPAIAYARDGYPVSPRVARDWHSCLEMLRNDKPAGDVFLRNGNSIGVGEWHTQPALAETLERIANGGRDAFYKGEVAQDMVDTLQAKGGLHTMEDFANTQGEYVTPVSTQFRDLEIFQCPPNGQGIIALLLLNIMKGMDVEGDGPMSLARVHAEIEAGRLAYHQRGLYVADPAQADVPNDILLSQSHADALRDMISGDQRINNLPDIKGVPHKDTVYISVVDKDRNACSFINSVYHSFGSVQMAPKSGVMLQNRGQAFVIDPDHPNCIAPNKRPMHTIIPGMGMRDGRAALCYGVMGGEYQAFGHMQFLTRLMDYGLDVQESMDAPRFFPDPFSDEVEVEGTIADDILDGLKALGHKLVRPAKPIGGSQAIQIDWERGVLVGGSDPRKDGCAIGY